MSMKRKRGSNLKAQNPKQDKYHLMFNNMLPSDSDLLCTNNPNGCCLMNINEYNYKTKECDWTRRWIQSNKMDMVQQTSTWHTPMFIDDIKEFSWWHKHQKSHWTFTGPNICFVSRHEEQCRIYPIILSYFNGGTSWIKRSLMYT